MFKAFLLGKKIREGNAGARLRHPLKVSPSTRRQCERLAAKAIAGLPLGGHGSRRAGSQKKKDQGRKPEDQKVVSVRRVQQGGRPETVPTIHSLLLMRHSVVCKIDNPFILCILQAANLMERIKAPAGNSPSCNTRFLPIHRSQGVS